MVGRQWPSRSRRSWIVLAEANVDEYPVHGCPSLFLGGAAYEDHGLDVSSSIKYPPEL
jgi:hypothetical protein